MTARELLVGYETLLLHRWDLVAAVLAKIHNVNVAKKSDLLHDKDFHPYRCEGSGEGQALNGHDAMNALKALAFA